MCYQNGGTIELTQTRDGREPPQKQALDGLVCYIFSWTYALPHLQTFLPWMLQIPLQVNQTGYKVIPETRRR